MFPAPSWMNPAQAASFRQNQQLREQGGYIAWLKNKPVVQKPVVQKSVVKEYVEFKIGDRIVDTFNSSTRGEKGTIVDPQLYPHQDTLLGRDKKLVLFDGCKIPIWRSGSKLRHIESDVQLRIKEQLNYLQRSRNRF